MIVFISCALPVIKPDDGTTPDIPVKTEQGRVEKKEPDQPIISRTRPKPPSGPNPRAVAAIPLIEQGRGFIKAGKPDDAIRVLERAVNLHSQNGEIYYHLAEAWLMKGNINQAGVYNRLARRYLRNKPTWLDQLQRQENEIESR